LPLKCSASYSEAHYLIRGVTDTTRCLKCGLTDSY